MIDARHPAGQPFFYEGNDTGVLLIHGFTGTCGQMRPLGEALRGAGYTVMAPLLPGHGLVCGLILTESSPFVAANICGFSPTRAAPLPCI